MSAMCAINKLSPQQTITCFHGKPTLHRFQHPQFFIVELRIAAYNNLVSTNITFTIIWAYRMGLDIYLTQRRPNIKIRSASYGIDMPSVNILLPTNHMFQPGLSQRPVHTHTVRCTWPLFYLSTCC